MSMEAPGLIMWAGAEIPVIEGQWLDFGRRTPLPASVILDAPWPRCRLPKPTGRVDHRDRDDWSATPLQKRFIHERDRGCCVACLRALAFERESFCDHIIPWAWGGWSVVQNLQLLCKACNSLKGDRYMIDCRSRVRRRVPPDPVFSDAAQIPVI